MIHKDTTLAYLAGAIDADGFITIARSTRKIGERYAHRPTYYNAKIGLTETSPIIPRLLQKTFGGCVYEHQPKNPKHKRWYIWNIQSRIAGQAIDALIPFLRLKKKQGVLVSRFIDHCNAHHLNNRKLSSKITEYRHKLWCMVTKLNDPRNRRAHFMQGTPVSLNRQGTR